MARAWKLTGMVLLCALWTAPVLASQMTPQQIDQRTKKIAGKFMCMCSCNEVLTQCNHVGCETSKSMLKEISDAVAEGKTEAEITQMIVQEYGTAVYAEPPKSGFSLVAWSMPTVYLFLGLGLVLFVISRWRKRAAPAAASANRKPQVPAELLDRVREQTERDSEE
jgi:cytochrome c-type biogenesis protein CcmH